MGQKEGNQICLGVMIGAGMAAVTELSVSMGSLLTFESLESPTFQEKEKVGLGTGAQLGECVVGMHAALRSSRASYKIG